MAINTNYPNVRPSLLLDFANSQQLDPRVTFSRSTTAVYYDGKTSALAEQNLFIYSNTFSNAAWVGTSATIASGVTDPAGGTTAFSMTATAGNATLYQTLTLTATAYTESIWIQRVTGTGTINLTLDGSTLSPVTITGSWVKYTYTATPSAGSKTIGIQIVTSGDAINIYGSQIENRSSATATNITTTTAITNYIPQLLTAPINAPRFDFNPTTGESLGLLIEQSSTNLLTYSQTFTNAAWVFVATNVIITATSNIAPDGTQTAQSLIADTSAGTSHAVRQGVVTTATSYACSVYVKANQLNQIFIREGNYTGAYSTFNLTAGTVTSNVSGGVGSISAVGNGWYRCTLVLTATANTSRFDIGVLPNSWVSGNALTWTGDGYSGIYIWGAQLEALAFPTSYIATTSAQVTRASDNASMTGTNVSSWYNIGQGTWYSEFNIIQNTTGWGLLSNQNIGSGRIFYSNNTGVFTYDGSNVGTLLNSTAINTFYKVASSLTQTLNTNCGSGNTPTTTATNGNLLNTTTLYIGLMSTSYLNGHIKKLSYYPQAVTSAQLQSLTGS